MIDSLFSFLKDNFMNPWILFGFFAQFIFFLRFIVQWITSEKEKKSVIPNSFWYLSIVGTVMILIYSIYRQDIVFIVASFLNFFIFARNLILIRRNKEN
jgi:lipid-A-disaccharide synthase-like uncharacterized protein